MTQKGNSLKRVNTQQGVGIQKTDLSEARHPDLDEESLSRNGAAVQHVKVPPATTGIPYQSDNVTLSCSLFDPAPCEWPGDAAENGSRGWAPPATWETQTQLWLLSLVIAMFGE